MNYTPTITKKTFLLICSCLFFISVYAQSKKDFNKIWVDAEFDLQNANYSEALKKWMELYKMDSTNANINFKVGFCHLFSSSSKTKAEPYLLKATQKIAKNYEEFFSTERNAPPVAWYYLGKAFLYEGKIDEAIVAFNTYKPLVRSNRAVVYKDINRQIEMCLNAKELMKKPVKFSLVDLGDSVNSKYADYSPVISADENTLIFTSRREGGTGGEIDTEGKYFEDIFVSYKTDSSWTKAISIGQNINTDGHEAAVNLSSDGTKLFIYRGEGLNGGDIYVSQLIGEVWGTPQHLPEPINSKDWETHAAITADENIIYFVSDRPGGKGKRDIWRSRKLPTGEWALPENMTTLNTEYDEEGIFIHPDGVNVYFSSQGFNSMGGFDIFNAKIQEDGSFSKPVNIGYPINSTDDDAYFTVSADGKRAYMSSAHEIAVSDKDKGLGEKDVYALNLEEREAANITLYRGTVLSGNDRIILDQIMVEVEDYNTGEKLRMDTRLNGKTGKFVDVLKPGRNYKITIIAGKYGDFSDTVMVPANSPYREINRSFDINPVKKEEVKFDCPDLTEYYKNFGYNDSTVDHSAEDFEAFISSVVSCIKTRKAVVNIKIEASASKVPTKQFKDNMFLAHNRGIVTQRQIVNALKSKGVNTNMVVFDPVDELVQGPEYNNDFLEKRAIYDKYQYVKVTAR